MTLIIHWHSWNATIQFVEHIVFSFAPSTVRDKILEGENFGECAKIFLSNFYIRPLFHTAIFHQLAHPKHLYISGNHEPWPLR